MKQTLTPCLMFDLGGVIMNIRRENAVASFEQLGMANADQFFDPFCQHGIFGALEAGQISPEEFRAEVRKQFRPGVTDAEIDAALCRFLLGIPSERLLRLAELRQAGHRVVMLSNTNPIMWHAFILPEFTKLGGTISDYFDDVVLSFEAKICKPDPRIYEYARTKLDLNPQLTTFYDDGAANVAAARQAGYHAQLITPSHDFMLLT